MKALGKLKAIALGAVLCAAAAVGVGSCAGCASTDAQRAAAKAEIAAVMRVAYDAGAKELVSNRIDRLVADGKITAEQAVYLHAVAQAAYERAVTRLEGGTNTVDAACADGACADGN